MKNSTDRNQGSASSLFKHVAKTRWTNSQAYQSPHNKKTRRTSTAELKHSTSVESSDSRSASTFFQNRNDPQLTINVLYTQYEILYDVSNECNLRSSTDEEEDWDIWYIDNIATPVFLQKMKNYQRTNHFPGIYVMARKNLLAKNLLAMQKYYPKEFQFFPKTWLLPGDMKAFKDQFNIRKAKTFIIKPEASCQGKGIFLTRNFEWFNPAEHYVAQRYLHKPYLIDGLKFDLRVYVNLTSVNPLRIFIYKEGLARFATSTYNSPIGSNLNNLFMHLTNYAINKDAENFKQNSGQDDVGHKRSMTSIFKHMDAAQKQDNNVISGAECWQLIKELTVKTVIACFSQIASIYRVNKPHDLESSLCHQVLGFDIFIDIKGKPWLIEVNQSPSFMTDSPLDEKVKKGVLTDSIKMLGLNWKRKCKYVAQNKQEAQNRLIGGPRMKNAERDVLRAKYLTLKDKHELKYQGDYERIYPFSQDATDQQLSNLYDKLIEASNAVWGESAAGGGVSAKQKIEELESKLKLKSKLIVIETPRIKHTGKGKSSFNATQQSIIISHRSELSQQTPAQIHQTAAEKHMQFIEYEPTLQSQNQARFRNTVYQNKPTELVQEFKLRYPSTSHKTTNSNTLPTETIQLPMQLNHINQQQTVPKLYTFKLDHLPKPAVSSHFGPLLFPSNNNSLIPLSQRTAPSPIQQHFASIHMKRNGNTVQNSPEPVPARHVGLVVTSQRAQQIVKTESSSNLISSQFQKEHQSLFAEVMRHHKTSHGQQEPLNTFVTFKPKTSGNKNVSSTDVLTKKIDQITPHTINLCSDQNVQQRQIQASRKIPMASSEAFKYYKEKLSKAINNVGPQLISNQGPEQIGSTNFDANTQQLQVKVIQQQNLTQIQLRLGQGHTLTLASATTSSIKPQLIKNNNKDKPIHAQN